MISFIFLVAVNYCDFRLCFFEWLTMLRIFTYPIDTAGCMMFKHQLSLLLRLYFF